MGGSEKPLIAALGKTPASKAGKKSAAEFQPPSTADYVKISAAIRAAGDHDEIAVTLKIAKGYHINANPATYSYLIPTRVSFDGITPISITYPGPVLFKPDFARDGIKVYEGSPKLMAKVPKGVMQKMKTVQATVTVQACNDKVCLPPSTLPLAINAPGRP